MLYKIAILFSLSLFSQSSLQQLSNFKLNRNIGYNDVWGYTDSNGKEYALLGVQDGTSVIDVSNPSNLVEIGFVKSPASSTWKDIKTFKHYAYVVIDRYTSVGLQIIDLSKLPESISLVKEYSHFKQSHNIYIDVEKELLFAQGARGAVGVYSLKDPTEPEFLSSFGVECHDIYARDNLIYVSEGGHGTIGIFDYSDPKNVKLVKRFEIPRAGYVHNAWLTKDSNYLMTTEENTGKTMKLWDISNLEDVTMTSEIIAPNKLAHNIHIKGDYAYVSHYGSGLRIYDLSNPNSLSEVAYFQKTVDTPSGFVSAWGAYPFFKSGTILISDIEDGLFVVTHESARETK